MKKVSGLKLAITAVLVAGALSPLNALAANKFIVMDTAGTTPQFVVTDTGWTGVGTNAPGAAIHVSGATKGNASQVKVFSTDATGAANGGGGFFLGHNNGPAGTPNNLPLQGDRIGYMNVGAIVDSQPGVNFYGGGFQFNAAANWSYDTQQHFPTYLALKTADVNTTYAPVRLAIYPSGSVYIGPKFTFATPPSVSQKLEVDGGARLIPQTGTQPACSASTVGTFWYVSSSDTVQVCTGAGWKTVSLI